MNAAQGVDDTQGNLLDGFGLCGAIVGGELAGLSSPAADAQHVQVTLEPFFGLRLVVEPGAGGALGQQLRVDHSVLVGNGQAVNTTVQGRANHQAALLAAGDRRRARRDTAPGRWLGHRSHTDVQG